MKISGLLLLLLFASALAYPAEFIEGNDKALRIKTVDSLNKIADASLDSNPLLAYSYIREALKLSNQIGYPTGEADALHLASLYFLANDKYVETLDCYYQEIDIYKELYDTASLVVCYGRVASFFYSLIKDNDLATKYLALLTKLARSSKDPATKGQLYIAWGQYYLSRGKCDSAILNLYLSIPYFHKAGATKSECGAYKNLGDVFMQKKMYSRAEFNYLMSLSLLSQKQNSDEVGVLYTRIAHIYQVLGNHAMNLKFNLSALRMREKIGRAYFISSSCLNVGEAYWFLGKKDSSTYYMQKALRLAEMYNKTFLLESIYSQLSDFARAEKKFELSLKYFKLYTEYNAKKNFDRNSSEFTLLEAKRTIRDREIKNDILKQETIVQEIQIRNQKTQIILFEIMIIIMLALIFVVYAVAGKNRKRKNELAELNARLSQEITERIEAEGRLNRSEELHRFLAENTVDVISLIDTGMNRLYISPSCEKFYGYSVQEIHRMTSLLDLVDPAFRPEVNRHFLDIFRTKKTTGFIYKVLRKDGTTFWAESNINPVINPATNEVEKLITVVRNVSERMKHEEELSENSRQKEYLLHEIHNRVKNNFAILISLMNMQRSQSENSVLNTSLNDLQLRVRTMSLVHEQLYQSQEISTIPFDNYLHRLAHIISSSYNNERIRMETDISPCTVAIETALPLGLIINELITNAYKYAFPGDRKGVIRVRLFQASEDKFNIVISDNGVGLPPDFTMKTTHSMGSQIVGILIEQIEASLTVTGNDGACFQILFSPAQEK